MDFAQLGQFIGSIGIPGALLFIIVLKMVPVLKAFTEHLAILTNEIRNLITHIDGRLATSQKKTKK